MRKFLFIPLMLTVSLALFGKQTPVTTATIATEYTNAADGDVLLLDTGTYATALSIPIGKTITLKKAATASKLPMLTFTFASTVTTTGSGIVFDSLDINSSGQYFIQLGAASVANKIVFQNCVIRSITRCLVNVTKDSISSLNELTIDNCILRDIGSGGYNFNYFRGILNNFTIKNSTVYNYQGEGFFLAQKFKHTNTFKFDMHNNTIYKSGKDGLVNYAWCVIDSSSNGFVTYSPTSTYNISNNIINKPFATANSRSTIYVKAGSGTVTCKNNLVIDYPNFTKAPQAGWDTSKIYISTTNYFKDSAKRDFTLPTSFPFKGTDGKVIGDPRWLPIVTYNKQISTPEIKVYPTLASNYITIVAKSIITDIKVIDIEGRQVASAKPNTQSTVVNITNISNGIYSIIIKTATSSETRKILVQK